MREGLDRNAFSPRAGEGAGVEFLGKGDVIRSPCRSRSAGVGSVISMNSTVTMARDQVYSGLDDEVAILGLKKGIYYGLNSVGARIWRLIQEPKTVREIRDTLIEEYDVDSEHCEREVLALLHDLAREGLIEVRDETDS